MRPGYDPLKGVHVSWGALLNLKLLGFFIFENRNSLEVTFSMFLFLLDLDKSVTIEKSVSIAFCLSKSTSNVSKMEMVR